MRKHYFLLLIILILSIRAFFIPVVDNRHAISDTEKPLDTDSHRSINHSNNELTPEEMALVATEVQAMMQTDAREIPTFSIKEATETRIERLLAMPVFSIKHKAFKEYALIFAGRHNLLTFDKPSDIAHKVASWFSLEMQLARKKDKPGDPEGLLTHVDLRGPFPNWPAESAAFMTLWKCMPENSLQFPTLNPFSKQQDFWNGGKSYTNFSQNMLFGSCAHRPLRIDELMDTDRVERANIIDNVLSDKFSSFLKMNGCKGTGPDDCVLILLLWSDLSPSDERLSEALKTLESDVKPDAPMTQPLPSPIMRGTYLEPCASCDEGLRKLAFLRAKLAAALGKKATTSTDDLKIVLHQMTSIRSNYKELFDAGQPYDLDGGANEFISPWALLTKEVLDNPTMQMALLDEVASIDDNSCTIYRVWVEDLPADFREKLTEQVIKREGKARRCAQRLH